MITILLVEDTLELAEVVQRELEAAAYRVLHAPNGTRALALHEQHTPDLVILDWMLPDLDGLEVLRSIRRTTVTPVLMLTARDDEIDRVVGLEAGADDYLTKPFSMRELIARVRAILRRVELIERTLHADQTVDDACIQRGDLLLDPTAHRVSLAGDPLDLSPTEFGLLHLLMRNPGRAFSRAYLLDTVWHGDYVSGDRSVDNAVLRLRKRLGSVGDEIETVWGVGYRFRADNA